MSFPKTAMSNRSAVVATAKGEIGYAAAAGNKTKYAIDYGIASGRAAWCAIFVWWCFWKNGLADCLFGKTSYANALDKFFAGRGMYFKRGDYTPQSGDVIFYDHNRNGVIDHCGIVNYFKNGYVYTIEGNVTGNKCSTRRYSLADTRVAGFGKTAFPDEVAAPVKYVYNYYICERKTTAYKMAYKLRMDARDIIALNPDIGWTYAKGQRVRIGKREITEVQQI